MTPLCHEAFFDLKNHTLAVALFFGALVGSVSHCAGMCGPFVLAQASHFKTPEGKQVIWYRYLLLPYHLGRLTTYILLGVFTTAVSESVLRAKILMAVSPFFLVMAGMLFLASAFSQILPVKYLNIGFSLCSTPKWITERVAPLLPSNSLFSGYLLGVLLGFLPCGLVYAAIMAVATTGNLLESAISMAAFAFGTMPMLILITFGGKLLHDRQYSWIKIASMVLMIFNSMMLFAMAGKGLI